MPTTPSPYGYNHRRYRKVPKRAKIGGLCGLFALGLFAVPTAILAIVGHLITQHL